MMSRELSAVFGLLAAFAVFARADEGDNPMEHVAAYSAVGAVVVVENSKENPFMLRFAGGDPRQISTAQGQLWVPIGEMMHQMLIAYVDEVMPGKQKQPADRAVLAAHAEWETKYHNEALNEHQVARPTFHEIAGRTWCHWTYDLSVLSKLRKGEPDGAKDGRSAKTQHVLSTVIGRKIVVLIGNTLAGEPEEDTRNALTKVAKTFVAVPKPLSPAEIKELCSQTPP